MKLLDNKTIMKYDYKKTRANVDQFMKDYEENYFKYIGVLPPSLTSHLCEIRVQMSRVNSSKVEKYVIKRIETEKDFLDYLNDAYDELLEKQGDVMNNLVRETELAVSNLDALGQSKEELDAAFASGKLN